MSYYDRPYYGGGGGGRGRRRNFYRDDYNQRETLPESPAEKLRSAVIKCGEVDAEEEVKKLDATIREYRPFNAATVAEAFHFAITEQPYKIPYYASLLKSLHSSTPGEEEQNPVGRLVLEDFWKGFQTYLDKQSWRETRLCIHFFAHLTACGIISVSSFTALIQAFTAVLEEFGGSHGRAKQAALCAAEGVIIAGPVLDTHTIKEVITSIQTYVDTTQAPKWLVRPLVTLYDSDTPEGASELLDSVVAALESLAIAETWPADNEPFPRPYHSEQAMDESVSKFDLPMVLVPPEAIELDGGSEDRTQTRTDEWPEWSIRLFPDDITPDPNSPVGYIIRSTLFDIINIFELNRKDCARLLLEYPKWTSVGIFRPKPGAPIPEGAEDKPGWQLESTIVESILSLMMLLPSPTTHPKNLYYSSLIVELAKLSPSTIGPAVGKSIRKLYSLLGGGSQDGNPAALDVDISRRFAEWFAVHMSNFNFQWVWKEWIPDLPLPITHPKRSFMRRAIELEIRLAYHDRIRKTLPEEMQSSSAEVMEEEAPVIEGEFEDPHNAHHDAFKGVLELFKTRASHSNVMSRLEELKTSLLESDSSVGDVDRIARTMGVQALLSIGSRSFSHLLNAIERYLPLLRDVAQSNNRSEGTGHQSARAKAEVLDAVGAYWKPNPQMISIVFDKLMQYQIVDPGDIVNWVFSSSQSQGSSTRFGAMQWDLLRGALDKANGRVAIARRKVVALRKEDDERRALAKAKASAVVDGEAGADSMDVDTSAVDGKQDETAESPHLTTALNALTSLSGEEKTALSAAIDGFMTLLTTTSQNPKSTLIISDSAWQGRADWGVDEWNAWESWGWWRHFCRAYAPYLRSYSTTFETVSFVRLGEPTDPAVLQFKKPWNVITGQEN